MIFNIISNNNNGYDEKTVYYCIDRFTFLI